MFQHNIGAPLIGGHEGVGCADEHVKIGDRVGMKWLAASEEQLSRSLGAAAFVDFMKEKDLVAAVKAATHDGLGPDAAIIAASGAKSYEQAISYVRPAGVLVPVGLPPDASISLDVFWSVFETKRVVPLYVGNRLDAIESLQLAADGLVRVMYQTQKLSDLPSIY
ncbi:alcohol dehydrogenase [Cladochytrium tenue]|nr:alcohol dehydrogenase [Cladochytrium tenue]